MKPFFSSILTACLLLSSLSLSAQYVSIPDANFRAYLQQTFPACFNASNQMDTTCTQITGYLFLSVSNKNIADLTGVQYFDGLLYLYFNSNQLSSLPPLPANLILLEGRNNTLASLGSLPPNLQTLTLDHNNLTALPALPSSLTKMNVGYNQLASLPVLPLNLQSLDCVQNALTQLPSLPASLLWLHCGFNQLTAFPPLPNNLFHFTFYGCQITSAALPAQLPANLSQFDGSLNPLTVFPDFSNCPNIEGINVGGTQIPSIPPLPTTVTDFRCHNNLLINSLPTLHQGLKILEIENCNIPVLPPLPNSLTSLQASYNPITNFPTVLPDSLRAFICDSCNITSIANIPPKLYFLSCNKNINLSCVPLLPLSMDYISLSGTSVNCLPNLPPNLSTLTPLSLNTVCGAASGCALYPQVTGKVFADANNNGLQDVGESPIAERIVHFQPGNWYALTDAAGDYVAHVPANTAFTQTTPNLLYYTTNPTNYSVNLAMGQVDSGNDFALYPAPNVEDLRVDLVSGVARPGFDMNYWITYQNEGTNSMTGSLSMTFDNSILTFLNASVAPNSQVGNVLTWNFNNLAPLARVNICLYFNVNSTTPLGTPLNANVVILPNAADVTPNNNNDSDSRLVQGAYDPNEIWVSYPSLTPAQVAAATELEYTIFFQNTGTDTAFNIKVIDSLTQMLDFSAFKVLAASHDYDVSFENPRALIFSFPHILLPDSNINEPGSHGFIKYRIRPLTSLVLGDIIPNRADIYFDYNVPILTNVATTTVENLLEIEVGMEAIFALFPNPADDKLTIKTKGEAVVSLQDLQARTLKREAFTDILEWDVKPYPAGFYLVRVQQGDKMSTQKLCVQHR